MLCRLLCADGARVGLCLLPEGERETRSSLRETTKKSFAKVPRRRSIARADDDDDDDADGDGDGGDRRRVRRARL